MQISVTSFCDFSYLSHVFITFIYLVICLLFIIYLFIYLLILLQGQSACGFFL